MSSTPADPPTTATSRVLRRVAVAALVLSVVLPVIGLAVTYLDPRFGNQCRPQPSGAVAQAFPLPVLALTLTWAGLAAGLTSLAGTARLLRTDDRSHGRWILVFVCATVLLVINALVLWNIYGTWVYGTPDCAW